MGLFSVPMTISGPDGGRSATVAALVDTGASHSMAPSDILDRLGIAVTGQVRVRTADNRVVVVPLGEAQIATRGRRAVAPLLFQPPGSRPILGVSALEALDFGVYTVYELLIPGEMLRQSLGPPAAGALP